MLLVMTMNNLDRFSSPLETERVNPYHMQQMIEEQQDLNKKHLVDYTISHYWANVGLVPDAEMIQELLYKVDIDLDLIQSRLDVF